MSHAAVGAYKYYKCTCGFRSASGPHRPSAQTPPGTLLEAILVKLNSTPVHLEMWTFNDSCRDRALESPQAPLCSTCEGLGLQIMFPWREDGPGREGELCPGVSRQHLALSPWGSHMRTLFSISQGREEDLPIPSSKDSDSFKLYLS